MWILKAPQRCHRRRRPRAAVCACNLCFMWNVNACVCDMSQRRACACVKKRQRACENQICVGVVAFKGKPELWTLIIFKVPILSSCFPNMKPAGSGFASAKGSPGKHDTQHGMLDSFLASEPIKMRVGPVINNFEGDWTNLLSVTFNKSQLYSFTADGATRRQRKAPHWCKRRHLMCLLKLDPPQRNSHQILLLKYSFFNC